MPGPEANGRTADHDAPNGLTDFVVIETALWMKAQGQRGLCLNFAVMRAVLFAATPKPDPGEAPDPAAERRKRLAACRARAWAAYKAAGGALEADGSDDLVTLDDPVASIPWTTRAANGFKREGIRTVGDLTARTAGELLRIKNFAQRTLDEVRAKLADRGLRLRGDPEPRVA